MTTERGTPEELEAFAKWMAIASEIMKTDRDLLLRLKNMHLEEKK